ncbi:hypothetical protein DYBT9623_01554 [Dyadobacter sp. CECT 9623]|uniref:Uncharacterized protein n=1 Tax=Dyadobacter linearis TaxID=2823330 RepID=A0ABN7R8Q1_9BACT|nr:hypothetical protein DYBT9623_01554 [Dyadobacter sp. CECT 9623]
MIGSEMHSEITIPIAWKGVIRVVYSKFVELFAPYIQRLDSFLVKI